MAESDESLEEELERWLSEFRSLHHVAWPRVLMWGTERLGSLGLASCYHSSSFKNCLQGIGRERYEKIPGDALSLCIGACTCTHTPVHTYIHTYTHPKQTHRHQWASLKWYMLLTQIISFCCPNIYMFHLSLVSKVFFFFFQPWGWGGMVITEEGPVTFL